MRFPTYPILAFVAVTAAIACADSSTPTGYSLVRGSKANVISCTGDTFVVTPDSVRVHATPGTDFDAGFTITNHGDSTCHIYITEGGTDSVAGGSEEPEPDNAAAEVGDPVHIIGHFHALSKRTGSAYLQVTQGAWRGSVPVVIMSTCDAGTSLSLHYFASGVGLHIPANTEFGGAYGGAWYVTNTGTQWCSTSLTQPATDSVATSRTHSAPSPSAVTLDPFGTDTAWVYGYWRTLSSGTGFAQLHSAFGTGSQLIIIGP